VDQKGISGISGNPFLCTYNIHWLGEKEEGKRKGRKKGLFCLTSFAILILVEKLCQNPQMGFPMSGKDKGKGKRGRGEKKKEGRTTLPRVILFVHAANTYVSLIPVLK